MLIIISVFALLLCAVVGSVYALKKEHKTKIDPITQHVEELAPESTPAPAAVEAIKTKTAPKSKAPKNAPKQKPLAKMEAKPKAKK
jgi:uncharacterized iron-regulated membrane protein